MNKTIAKVISFCLLWAVVAWFFQYPLRKFLGYEIDFETMFASIYWGICGVVLYELHNWLLGRLSDDTTNI